ncbi:hypothetical protein FC826_14685 [Clostridium botulinum]|uniref:Uncharacterized protein n=1 Tax=Clostridium botulinum TaxID=1491 RepID=A0A6B4TLN9_CLOBO|nr:hypothetical protein [Clostridium botulinum]NFD85620.1 hypothetical protein [Clostridium botulinum]NFE08823.1 hypothetical protein [Clostridium botulinum]NFE34913.1 hypothetical protein [Clostridium botulinum]NFE49796.1 hypothetical protein [Clostridium botulinum]
MLEIDNEYRDRLRLLLILYFFSENYNNPEKPHRSKILESEVKIQKIDFLIRYPDYFSYELIDLCKNDSKVNPNEIKLIVKDIFNSKESEIRCIEMTRYLFGAYEELDNIVSFLVAYGFLEFNDRRSVQNKHYKKKYFLTNYAIEKIQNEILINLPAAKWYIDRCSLIKKFFGDLSGTELKIHQYNHEEYRTTALGDYITNINEKVKSFYKEQFGEEL